jgi:hypothetical protein
VDSGNYYFGDPEEDEEENQPKVRPHYRRQTESRSNSAPDWSVGATNTAVPTAPDVPAAPPTPSE